MQRAILLSSLILASAAAAYASPVTYTDTQGDEVGSTNKLRDIWSASVDNDASNLIITININSAGDLGTGGNFNYGVGITTGQSTAGGDTQASATHGNPYSRTISIDSSLGGMTDWIGIFGAGASGANGSATNPFTSYGFNDYVYGTPNNVTDPSGVWTKKDTVSNGMPIAPQSPSMTNSSVTITVPFADFADNLSLTPGTTIYFDIYSTGTSAGQTAYDSLADASPTNGPGGGGGSATAQYNGTILDSYTIQVAPEPAMLGSLMLGGLAMGFKRKRR